MPKFKKSDLRFAFLLYRLARQNIIKCSFPVHSKASFLYLWLLPARRPGWQQIQLLIEP